MESGAEVQQAVGYTRVSSQRQDDRGNSLLAQQEEILQWARGRGVTLLGIYSDSGSARGPLCDQLRPDVLVAINKAAELGVPIVVTSPDRLCRDLSIIPLLEELGVRVISVKNRGVMSKRSLTNKLLEAQQHGEEIADNVSKSVRKSAEKGIVLGNTKNLSFAQRRGKVANGLRADRKTQELADFLAINPDSRLLTLKKLVQLLNSSGVHNLVSERHSRRKPWTPSALRKPLKRAEEELALQRLLDAEDAAPFPAQQAASAKDHLSESRHQYASEPGFGQF